MKIKKVDKYNKMIVVVLFFAIVVWSFPESSYGITRSIGYPFDGSLENGIPFPKVFKGYQLRSEDHTYSTPEVIGALMEAIENVRSDFPDTCDLYLGDFSKPGGGPWYPVHKSHQNGRDVDIGMYAKNNIPLTGLIPMNEENLDLAKNWSLVLHLVSSQLVEHIFVDITIQKLLYDYALAQGYDKDFLDRLFQAGSGAYESTVVRHEPNHRDHYHVRFVAPWSELAGRLDTINSKERQVIELAQSSFLPKRVIYYAKGEVSPEALGSKLGVPSEDIIRWNNLQKSSVIHPGMPIVFYKRGFDIDGLRLAMSLDASFIRSSKAGNLALIHDDTALNIPTHIPPPIRPTFASAKGETRTMTYKVKKGETLASIAKRFNISPSELAKLNKLSANKAFKPGKDLKLPYKREISIAGSLQSSSKGVKVANISKSVSASKGKEAAGSSPSGKDEVKKNSSVGEKKTVKPAQEKSKGEKSVAAKVSVAVVNKEKKTQSSVSDMNKRGSSSSKSGSSSSKGEQQHQKSAKK